VRVELRAGCHRFDPLTNACASFARSVHETFVLVTLSHFLSRPRPGSHCVPTRAPTNPATRSSGSFTTSVHLELPEELLEGIQPLVPEPCQLGQHLRRVSQRPRAELAAISASAEGPPQQAGALEDLNVFGNSFERHVEGCRQLGDRLLLARESAQDLATRRVSQRTKYMIEMVGSGLNH
jgi:hypothetical protein